MKQMFGKFTNAVSDYTVGTVIAIVLTALARRHSVSETKRVSPN